MFRCNLHHLQGIVTNSILKLSRRFVHKCLQKKKIVHCIQKNVKMLSQGPSPNTGQVYGMIVYSVQQQSEALKFVKATPLSASTVATIIRFYCSCATFMHSWHFFVFHSLQPLTPDAY